MASRFMQTGDVRWWSAMRELAAHVTDIDLYHTTGDRAAYNGGYFWHTQHYAAAGTATHRAYSRLAVSSGGGPSAEHNYTTGLMLAYFLTGIRAIARRGACSWRTGSSTWTTAARGGSAGSIEVIPDLPAAPDRRIFMAPAAAPATRSMPARRASADRRAAISREGGGTDCAMSCIPTTTRTRWTFSTLRIAGPTPCSCKSSASISTIEPNVVCLTSATRYAREVLLNYAHWMVEHERPYLERPEKLEYPNETWAAQDIRKRRSSSLRPGTRAPTKTDAISAMCDTVF